MLKKLCWAGLIVTLMFSVTYPQWSLPLGVNVSEGDTIFLTFGVNPMGLNGYDPLDIIHPPCPMVLDAYFELDDPLNPLIDKLYTDIQAAGEPENYWKVEICGGVPSIPYPNLVWDNTGLPSTGEFLVGSAYPSGSINWETATDMRTTNIFNFLPAQYAMIRYSGPVEDTDPPYTMNWNPYDGETDVPVDTDIDVDVLDAGVGVDETSIIMYVPGVGPVPPSLLNITPITGGFHVSLPSMIELPTNTDITIILNADDLNDNHMADTITFTTATDSTGFTLSGYVYLDGAASFENSLVILLEDGSAITNASGYYEVTGLEEMTYNIHAAHDGYDFAETTMSIIGDTTWNVTLYPLIDSLGDVSGTVLLEGASGDLSNSIVEIYGFDTDTTDYYGNYSFIDVPFGPQVIIVSHDSYLPDTMIFILVSDTVLNFSLESIIVDTSANITGIVGLEGIFDDLSGTVVELVGVGVDTTDIAGFYSFIEVLFGEYTLIAYHDGYYPDTAIINLTDDTTVNFYLFELDDTSSSVWGNVYLMGVTGDLSGSIVEILGVGMDTTDYYGDYMFDEVINEEITVIASHEGFFPDTVVLGLVSDTMIDFELEEMHFDPPSFLEASDTLEEVIRVTWRSPYEDKASLELELLGYELYRCLHYFEEPSEAALIAENPASASEYLDEDIEVDTWYYYRVNAVYNYGVSEFSNADSGFCYTIGITSYKPTVPAQLGLQQNYPNPFNPTTSFSFSLPQSGEVRFTIHNVMGTEMDVLIDNQQLQAGEYRLNWDASKLDSPSGIYFYRLQFGTKSIIKNMLFIK
ncbi:T9SS type A sorting domain-containing protein [bacterium]|nr:T9SS type A sorting domain-containing protein [bacterium]